jgi:TorA maturation chaperone TorD
MNALRDRMLHEHLGAWSGPFTRSMDAGAQTEFYRALATFTGAFLEREAATSGP